MAADNERFCVYQFFDTGGYERVREFVSSEEAVKAARHYTTSVAARMGITTRVIITDGGDLICFEWIYGKGVVFPTEEQVDAALGRKEQGNGG